METLQALLLVLQVVCALALIGFVLVQHGKGADAGAAFGSGASTTVFGAQGSGNFLTRTTAVLAFTFLVNSLALAWIARERSAQVRGLDLGVDSAVIAPQGEETPAADSAPAADDVPAMSDGPAAGDVPAASEAPATDDVPAVPAVPE